jgi:hypothetical protein
MNGPVELYKACKKPDVKPNLGLKAYFVDDRSGITRQLQRQRAMEVHYAPNPALSKSVPLFWASFVRTF